MLHTFSESCLTALFSWLSISAMKLDLLNKTNMVDFAVDCYKNMYSQEEVPERKIFITF